MCACANVAVVVRAVRVGRCNSCRQTDRVEKKKKNHTTAKPDGPSGLMTATAHVFSLRPHDDATTRRQRRRRRRRIGALARPSVANLITWRAFGVCKAARGEGSFRRQRVKNSTATGCRVVVIPPPAIRAGNVVSVPERRRRRRPACASHAIVAVVTRNPPARFEYFLRIFQAPAAATTAFLRRCDRQVYDFSTDLTNTNIGGFSFFFQANKLIISE